MQWVQALLLVVAGFFFLVKGADVFVDRASGLAAKLGMSPVVIGLTIVAFGTSMPELAVSVTAALEGSNEIAVGNVVGSNIFNLLVVGGMSACIYPLVVSPIILKRDWPLSALASLLLMLMILWGSDINRFEGMILLALFVFLLYRQIQEGRKENVQTKQESRSTLSLIVFLIIGIAFIVAGGQLAVQGAVQLAELMGWSQTLIGLTIVAIGTSLPELMTSIIAAKKGENEIAMGNVIGSNLFNILCILGVSSVLTPIHVESTAVWDTLILTVLSFVYWLLVKRFHLGSSMGFFMVMTYVLYMIYILFR